MADPSRRNGLRSAGPEHREEGAQTSVTDRVRNENLRTLGQLLQVSQDLVQQLGYVALELPTHPLPLTR